MDRSFLSQTQVIAASRSFVCIRLATYENADEAAWLRSLARTGSGQLENTVFAVLSPDGSRKLARASRSARDTFGDTSRMADTLRRIAAGYADRPDPGKNGDLPLVVDVRLGVNIAAGDHLPLVVVYARDETVRRDLRNRLGKIAWADRFIGRFIYAEASSADGLRPVRGEPAEGILVIQPDEFGLNGTVLTRTTNDATAEQISRCLDAGDARATWHDTSFHEHVRRGKQLGVYWDTAVPVTDPMEIRARGPKPAPK